VIYNLGDGAYLVKKDDFIYCVTYVEEGLVSIIDGDKISEIEIGHSHSHIFSDDKKNLYIVNSRTSEISIIDKNYKVEMQYNVPNNGNIEVDIEHKKIYACDGEKIYICNLESGKITTSIDGFSAISSMRLDKRKKRLFVLDALNKELSIYDTTALTLITKYVNIGFSPYYICLEEKEEYIYVGNKGGITEKYKSCVVKLNIITGEALKIYFENGSLISSIQLGIQFLYAINTSLNQVEIIDTFKEENIGVIKTKLKELKKIYVYPAKNVLLLIGTNPTNGLAIEAIDTVTNTIKATIFFSEVKYTPFDIAIISKGIEPANNVTKPSTKEDGEKVEDEELKNYLKNIYYKFYKIKLEKIQKENEILKLKENIDKLKIDMQLKENQVKYHKEKNGFYIKYNETLKEKNEYLKKKLFESDKENIIIKEKLAEKTRFINTECCKNEKNNPHISIEEKNSGTEESAITSIFKRLFHK
jgi:hypothetical protein